MKIRTLSIAALALACAGCNPFAETKTADKERSRVMDELSKEFTPEKADKIAALGLVLAARKVCGDSSYTEPMVDIMTTRTTDATKLPTTLVVEKATAFAAADMLEVKLNDSRSRVEYCDVQGRLKRLKERQG